MKPTQEEYRPALAAEIAQEITRANAYMHLTNNLLCQHGYDLLANVLGRLFYLLLPILVQASPHTPVHHAPWVVYVLARILIGRGSSARDDLWVGLPAALFHDCGLSRCSRRKIVEAEIDTAVKQWGLAHPDVQRLIQDAIASRLEHAEHSAQIWDSIVAAHGLHSPVSLWSALVTAVRRLILCHDHLKIGTLQYQLRLPVDPLYVFTTAHSQLYWDHLLADLTWMIEEIETDRERDRRLERTPKPPLEQLEWNVKCHRDIVKLYETEFPDEFFKLGFLEGLPIRNQHGLDLYLELEREVRGRY
ncbi:MAG: hypothetical protein ACKV0T_27085 [Planctomycetales bacterium]